MPHAGGLHVLQDGETVEFTFNLPMVLPLRDADLPDGVIDLMGPHWCPSAAWSSDGVR